MATVTAENFSTLAETTTTSDPGSSGTSLAVSSRSNFPQTGQFRLVVQDADASNPDQPAYPPANREIVLVTGGLGSGAGSFTVTRGREGTSGVAHASGSYVGQVLTAEAQKRWMPDYCPQPRHFGFLAWNYPVGNYAGATTPVHVTLVPWLHKIYIPETMTLGTLHCYVVTAGATLTAGSNLGAVYNSSGTRLGTTATQASTWTSTGVKNMALTADGGQSLTINGGPDVFVWACLLSAGTTQPCFARWSTTIAGWVNGNLSAAQSQVGKLAAVSSGSGPPTSFTPSSAITQEATPEWVAFS